MGRRAASRTLAYRTTLRQPTRETPVALAFEAKALIPMESELDVLCTSDTTVLALALNKLEENRDRVVVRIAKYHCQAARQRDKLVKSKAFKRGDLVL